MASLLTDASAINYRNLSDAVAQTQGYPSAEAKREAEEDAAYYRVEREDPNEEKVRDFYEQFTELKNKWSNKSNRSDKLVEEISDATYYYEEWKNNGNLDLDSNYGNPKYQRKYKRWNTKYANFLKKVRPRNFNNYTTEEKNEYRELRRKKPKSFGAVLNNLVTSLDQEARDWYPSSSDESSGGRRKRKTKRKRKKSRRKSRKKRKTRKKRKSKKKRRKRR